MQGVQRPDLAVGAEVGCRNLKGDLIVCQFVHLLRQKVGFSHQGVGFHNLLSETRQALTKKLIPDTHADNRTQRSFIHKDEDLTPVTYPLCGFNYTQSSFIGTASAKHTQR